jgi:hypothetical protein
MSVEYFPGKSLPEVSGRVLLGGPVKTQASQNYGGGEFATRGNSPLELYSEVGSIYVKTGLYDMQAPIQANLKFGQTFTRSTAPGAQLIDRTIFRNQPSLLSGGAFAALLSRTSLFSNSLFDEDELLGQVSVDPLEDASKKSKETGKCDPRFDENCVPS